MTPHPSTAPLTETDSPPRDPLEVLWQAATTRLRCAAVARAVADGKSAWFTLNHEALVELLPSLAERWRLHDASRQVFPADSPWAFWTAHVPERLGRLDSALAELDSDSACRARVDLAVVAVLLGASTGPDWSFEDRADRASISLALPAQRLQRDELLDMLNQASGAMPTPAEADTPPATESAEASPKASLPDTSAAVPPRRFAGEHGLYVAVLKAFQDGVFSDHAVDPLRVDARALTRLDAAAVRALFQSAQQPPVPGLEGRVSLLRQLGEWLEAQAKLIGCAARPSLLLDRLRNMATKTGAGGIGDSGGVSDSIDAAAALHLLARSLAPIWPQGRQVLGLPAGDVGVHPWAGGETAQGFHRATAGWVPFHHRSQQLLLALVEPLRAAGLALTQWHGLSCCPSLHVGRSLLERGIVVPRQMQDLAKARALGHELVVEWRALCTHLTNELADLLTRHLGLSSTPIAALVLAQDVLGAWESQPVVKVTCEGSLM